MNWKNLVIGIASLFFINNAFCFNYFEQDSLLTIRDIISSDDYKNLYEVEQENYMLKKENLELKNRSLINKSQSIIFPVLLIFGIFTSFFMASLFFRNSMIKLNDENGNLKNLLKIRDKELTVRSAIIKSIEDRNYNE